MKRRNDRFIAVRVSMTMEPVNDCHGNTINQKNTYHRNFEAQTYDILDGPLHQCTFRKNKNFGTWYKKDSTWTTTTNPPILPGT